MKLIKNGSQTKQPVFITHFNEMTNNYLSIYEISSQLDSPTYAREGKMQTPTEQQGKQSIFSPVLSQCGYQEFIYQDPAGRGDFHPHPGDHQHQPKQAEVHARLSQFSWYLVRNREPESQPNLTIMNPHRTRGSHIHSIKFT